MLVRMISSAFTILNFVRSHGGLTTTATILSAGFSRRSIASALQKSRLFSVARGWYADTSEHPGVFAVRMGGSLSCLSAAQHHGIWIQHTAHPHIRFSGVSMNRRLDAHPIDQRFVAHWQHPRWHNPLPWLDSPLNALSCICRCQNHETAVAAIDSAMNSGVISAADCAQLIHHLPRRLKVLGELIDANAESGLESLARLRLRAIGLRPKSQTVIPGVGRVDLLLCGLIVELDGKEFHEHRFEQDRRRDAAAAQQGFETLRFSYRQVMFEWPDVEAAILSSLMSRH